MDDYRIFAGESSRELAARIAQELDMEVGALDLGRYSDGELYAKFEENIRGKDIFVVLSTIPPADNLMQLLLILDAAKRASARRTTCVIPYFGYARQDRKDQPRVAIGAKLVADLLTAAGASRILTMDLHAAQIQGFFNIPFDHLYGSAVLLQYLKDLQIENCTVLAPDIGSVKMARSYAKRLGADLAIIDKRRPRPNAAEVMNLIGEVANRNVVIVDDMIDTAGTVSQSATAAKELGARNVICACTHALFSGSSIERLSASPIRELVVTDTIPNRERYLPDRLTVLSVAPIFAEAIRMIHDERSISSLFSQ
ncbi:MAG: ribose-phosphate pyrophosphokinase [Calditrichaeota bacterium]|nr:ribose-phosphate pyrophosphokinase [Candidatus Cloacimonadota bacterium]MCA9786698.1 ribose-phosphate pyrophosphokinase [Candidatus Cloacimonadota bacterium]MCB1047357.1 ribose-phosphate pyrophosphokinase [Calditrichota bacterium]MCB9475082.1 ribose-phosphate pyrophosphokinase [Candidatus Delongbacteria bacterium]